MTNVTCGLTAKTPGSAPCPTLVIEYGTIHFTFIMATLVDFVALTGSWSNAISSVNVGLQTLFTDDVILMTYVRLEECLCVVTYGTATTAAGFRSYITIATVDYTHWRHHGDGGTAFILSLQELSFH